MLLQLLTVLACHVGQFAVPQLLTVPACHVGHFAVQRELMDALIFGSEGSDGYSFLVIGSGASLSV